MNKENQQQLYRADLIAGALENRTVRDVAQTAGVCNETVLRGAAGENLTIEKLRALAQAIGVSIRELVTCEGDVITKR